MAAARSPARELRAGPINTVTADSTITMTNFNFDGGNWTVENAVALTVNVTDYDPDSVTNAFDATITLNGGDISVNTADAEFVMDGTLNLSGSATPLAFWAGEPLDIGNDVGVCKAHVNDWESRRYDRFELVPRSTSIPTPTSMWPTGPHSFWGLVDFDTVNGANNAEFTGAGISPFMKVPTSTKRSRSTWSAARSTSTAPTPSATSSTSTPR